MKLSALVVCFAAMLVANAQIIPPIIPPLFPPLGLLGGFGLGFPFLGGLGGLGLLGRPFLARRLLLGKRDVDLLPSVETPVKAETLEVVPEKSTDDVVQVPEVEVKPDTVQVPQVEVKPDIVQVVSEKPMVEVPGVPQVEYPEVPPMDITPDAVQLMQVPTIVDKPENVPVVLKPTRTMCAISSVSRVLKCEGVSVEENFECEVIPSVQHISNLKLRLADLTIKAAVNETSPVFELLSKKSAGKFTFVNPVDHTNEILSIYMEQTVEKPGFLVRDRLCFAQFVSLISFLPIEQLKLTVLIN